VGIIAGWGCRGRIQGVGFGYYFAGFGVQGSGFRVQGSGFRVQGVVYMSPVAKALSDPLDVVGKHLVQGVGSAFEFGFSGLGFRVWVLRFGVEGFGFRVSGGLGFGVWRLGLSVWGVGSRVSGFRVQGSVVKCFHV
jgi:hypothetical protein